MKKYKNIIKLSNLLLDAIYEIRHQGLHQMQSKFDEFGRKCSYAIKDSHLFNTAIERGWCESAEKIKTRVSRDINDFSCCLQRFKVFISGDKPKLPNLSDIFAELSQIEQELGEYKFDLKEKTISVITEPVTLEDIDLGPFEIRLSIDQISGIYNTAPYEVIALEPNPAGSDCNVTHPHVSHDRVCEGDGHIPIRRALEQGRFCDFFTLIVNILQTYNPQSPYVELDKWEGRSCYDCGCTVSDEDCYCCESCDESFCAYCSTCCEICSVTICLGCAYQCPSCEIPVCGNCTAKCKDCEKTFCENCVNEKGLCEECQEKRKENKDDEQENKSNRTKTDTAVQPDSVGKIAVHA